MTSTDITLTVATERSAVACEVTSQRMVEWTISVAASQRQAERAPLNLALILDRSGSMQGDKLRNVRQAASHVLDLLDERDRAAIVAYDDQVLTLAPSTAIGDRARADLKRAIGELQPGGWTDLGGGWLTGCQQIAGAPPGDALARALLLTDGLANRGMTDIEELTHHARELRRRGIATSTFGVGLDFNEQLLEALAEQGGGRFYYIERPAQIPAVFHTELGNLLTVVAREAFLSIGIPRGVGLELLGDLPHERQGDRLRVYLGDLCAQERRHVYTRALVPPDAPGTALALHGELGYANIEGRSITLAATVLFSYLREAQVLQIPVAAELLERAGEVELATATAQALRLERAGQRQQAQALLQRQLASSPAMPAPAAAHYQLLADQLGAGLSEEERKATHFAAYKARQSR